MTCLDCPAELGPRNKSGRCRACFNRFLAHDPEFQHRRAEGIRRKFLDPEHRAKMAAIARRNSQKAAANPEHRAWLVERGKRLYRDVLSRPDIRARNRAAVIAATKGKRPARLAWCPDDLYPHYQYLIRTKRMLAADAREAVEKIIAERASWQIDIAPVLDFLRRRFPVSKVEGGYRIGTAIHSRAEAINRARALGFTTVTNENEPPTLIRNGA